MARFRFSRPFAALGVALVTLCFLVSALAYSTIPYGEISENVRKMQQTLKDKGYFPEKVDGVFGPETLIAVCQFQSDKGLTVDGQPGNNTLKKLYAKPTCTHHDDDDDDDDDSPAVSHSYALSLGSSGTRVYSLQQGLANAGYYFGWIDGSFGWETQSAVESFQWDHLLIVDGIAGAETWTSLFGDLYNPPYYP